jgi:hypothetical protein
VARDLPAGTRAAVEAFAIRRSPRRTAARLRQDLAAEAARLDPGHAARAAAAGVGERDVALRPSPLPGCQRLVADLPRLSATAAWLAVNGAAVAAKDRGVRPDGTIEDRGLGQLRADLLAAVLTGTADPGQPTVVPAPAELAALAEVQVVVGADTLSGAVDTPAHVPGVGPLDADTARDIAARARWRRSPASGRYPQVADPDTGTLIAADPVVLPAPEDDTRAGDDGDVGGDPRLARLLTDPAPSVPLAMPGYRPSDRLRLHVHTRDATCLGPACSHPSRGTQLDHTIDHGRRDARGVLGVTAEHNLGSLCQRVHNGKTHGGWDLAQPTPGEFVWTSPTGRVYHRRARPLLPGWPQRRREQAEREPQPP